MDAEVIGPDGSKQPEATSGGSRDLLFAGSGRPNHREEEPSLAHGSIQAGCLDADVSGRFEIGPLAAVVLVICLIFVIVLLRHLLF